MSGPSGANFAWPPDVALSRHQGVATVSCGLRPRHRPVRRTEHLPRLLTCALHGPDDFTSRRRPLGVRLWLADLAAGLRFSRACAGAADRRASGAVRILTCPSGNAGAA